MSSREKESSVLNMSFSQHWRWEKPGSSGLMSPHLPLANACCAPAEAQSFLQSSLYVQSPLQTLPVCINTRCLHISTNSMEEPCLHIIVGFSPYPTDGPTALPLSVQFFLSALFPLLAVQNSLI